MTESGSQRGLLKLMLRMPALRGDLQVLCARSQSMRGLCEAFDEASDMLEQLGRSTATDPAMLSEYEVLCRDIEAEVIQGCLADGRVGRQNR